MNTSRDAFTVLKNAIDDQLEIIRHDETGFYNITKTATMVMNILKTQPNTIQDESEEEQAAPIRAASSKENKPSKLDAKSEEEQAAPIRAASSKENKRARKWFVNASTTKLIDQIKLDFNLDLVSYELKKDTPVEFAGTYVHKYLYQHFLMWLDALYAIKILTIIDDIQETANRKALRQKNIKIKKMRAELNGKDDTISEIRTMMAKQEAMMAKQEARAAEADIKLNQLIEFSNKTVGQNHKLQLTIDMNHQELSESLDYLVDKSYHSTIDPDDDGKVTHFAVLAPNTENRIGRTILVRGQTKYIESIIDRREKTHTPVIDTTYNANAINLIVNAKAQYEKMIRSYILKYNKPIKEYNLKIKAEIAAHNKSITKMKRMKQKTSLVPRQYALEMKPLLTLSDIPIRFKTTYIWYDDNEHISYQDVIQTIVDMNKTTQKSPIMKDLATDSDSSSSDDE